MSIEAAEVSRPAPHAQYHNVYGMLMVRASREGILAANPDKRPFVLTRANYIGGHRYAATWTGDNMSNWKHLEDSVPMILNLGLSGQPFCGPDIGGFIQNGDARLFARWFGAGVFFPFCRGHTGKGNRDKEPWSFGKSVEDACRTALERRYRLLPYLYTLFRESARTGLPIMRPVFFADPADPALRDEDDAFLLGDDLLVLPKLTPDAGVPFSLPDGIWRTFTLVNEDPTKDVNQPELRIRGGAILPLGRVIQSTAEQSLDPLTLLVCLDENGEASGTLYEDAGEGFGYREGEYALTTYAATRREDTAIVEVARREGALPRRERTLVIELLTPEGVIRAKGPEHQGVLIEMEQLRMEMSKTK